MSHRRSFHFESKHYRGLCAHHEDVGKCLIGFELPEKEELLRCLQSANWKIKIGALRHMPLK